MIDKETGAIGLKRLMALKPDVKYTADDIIKKCKEHLTAFKVPKNVIFVQSGKWPTSATAKIRKIDLRQMAARNSVGRGP